MLARYDVEIVQFAHAGRNMCMLPPAWLSTHDKITFYFRPPYKSANTIRNRHVFYPLEDVRILSCDKPFGGDQRSCFHRPRIS